MDSINYNEHRANLFNLQKVSWSVFGSLTWNNALHRADTDKARALRHADFDTLLTRVCKDLGVRRKHIGYYHATEYGKGNQCHLHFLLWDKRGCISSEVLASKIQEVWNTEFVLARHIGEIERGAVVEVYDHTCLRKPAVQYCLKREFDSKGFEREPWERISDNLLRHLIWLAK